jgi:hypothetical protein
MLNIPANRTPYKSARPDYDDESQQGQSVFRRLFLSHPASVGESYFQHQRMALSLALALLGAGLAAMTMPSSQGFANGLQAKSSANFMVDWINPANHCGIKA